ncbi:MAG: trypsin-like peptidase domain-containing protein [Candidatus Cloacimonetes bacterium]|nr:trypsin-like peptidase domain-containing protein [Candidatus Cloacimonadota bacterium]MDD3143017.1 trypsin-like peptidase domain-containing protein [Candidatus Cloacimonadota bacterium]
MKRYLYFIIIMVLCVLSACTSNRSVSNLVNEPSPIRIENSASITFTNLIIRIDPGTTIGFKYRSHYDYAGDILEEYRWVSNISIAAEDYKILALETLHTYGYNVLGGNDILFGRNEGAKAEYQLGALLTDMYFNSYGKDGYRYNECFMSIEWQLFDVYNNSIVYKKVYNGDASVISGSGDVLRQAYLSSLYRLLSDSDFARIVSISPKKNWLESSSYVKKISIKQNSSVNQSEAVHDIESLKNTVIVIQSGNSLGSGVMVSDDGWALTAAHVVSGLDKIRVKLHSGLQLFATVERIDEQQDVALIKIEGLGFPFMTIGDTSVSKIGEVIYAIGSPMGESLSYSLTKGVISGFRDIDDKKYIQIDASVNPGNSGGPLISEDGRLIGIVSQKIVGLAIEGISFCVPIEALSERLSIIWE